MVRAERISSSGLLRLELETSSNNLDLVMTYSKSINRFKRLDKGRNYGISHQVFNKSPKVLSVLKR